MAAPSFLEGAGGTGLHALQVQDVEHEATVAVHDPEVAEMYARQELEGAEVFWASHPLVKRIPTTSSACSRKVDLTADARWETALALYNGLIDLKNLVVSERLLEEALAVFGNVRHGPGIHRINVLKPGGVWREPELNRLASGDIVAE